MSDEDKGAQVGCLGDADASHLFASVVCGHVRRYRVQTIRRPGTPRFERPLAASYVLSYGDGDAPLRFNVWSEPEIPNKTQGDFVYQTRLHRGTFRFVARTVPTTSACKRRSRPSGGASVPTCPTPTTNHAGRVLPTPDVRRGTDRQRRLRPSRSDSSTGFVARTTIVVPDLDDGAVWCLARSGQFVYSPRPTGETARAIEWRRVFPIG